MFIIFIFCFLLTNIFANDNFQILITINESTSFINDINGLSYNQTLIYLLYTYVEPYQLVKLNTSTMLSIDRCILPFHYNDTIFREDFFLVPFTDDLMFIGYVENPYKPEGGTWLQGIDLRSMTIDRNMKQMFSFQSFTKFIWVQSVPITNKILVNLWQWDLTTNELTKPKITGGSLPSSDSLNNWLLPSTSFPEESPYLLLLFSNNILFTLNINSSSEWKLNTNLSKISLDFLSKSLSFHLDIINSTTIAVVDNQMNIFIYNLYTQQLTLTLNLRQLFPDYPRMIDQIANNLSTNKEFIYVTSSTNTEPNDQQYLFRICLNNTKDNVDLLGFEDENFGLTELVTSKDTVYSFERLYEAEDYFNIYKIGTPTKK